MAERIKPQVQPFKLQDVRLGESPFQHAMRMNARYLLMLEPDRLLHRFRLYAGRNPRLLSMTAVKAWGFQGTHWDTTYPPAPCNMLRPESMPSASAWTTSLGSWRYVSKNTATAMFPLSRKANASSAKSPKAIFALRDSTSTADGCHGTPCINCRRINRRLHTRGNEQV